jgi:hypothetical protein
MRRRLAWGVALPLVLAGSQAAHSLAYALVYPQAEVRAHTLLRTGHAYLTWLPFALAAAAACALVTLAFAVADAAKRRRAREVPAWAFGLLAPIAFAVQEVLELSLHTGSFGWRAVAAPTFVPGLLLQLPFALAAWLAARVLLRAARALGGAFVRPRAAAAMLLLPFALPRSAARGRTPRSGAAPRGPPRVAAI